MFKLISEGVVKIKIRVSFWKKIFIVIGEFKLKCKIYGKW